jgi:hypothetical protein
MTRGVRTEESGGEVALQLILECFDIGRSED